MKIISESKYTTDNFKDICICIYCDTTFEYTYEDIYLLKKGLPVNFYKPRLYLECPKCKVANEIVSLYLQDQFIQNYKGKIVGRYEDNNGNWMYKYLNYSNRIKTIREIEVAICIYYHPYNNSCKIDEYEPCLGCDGTILADFYIYSIKIQHLLTKEDKYRLVNKQLKLDKENNYKTGKIVKEKICNTYNLYNSYCCIL